MHGHRSAFRDHGLLPDGLRPPPEKVRCYFSTARLAGQYAGTAIAAALGVGLVALLTIYMPAWLAILGGAAVVAGCTTLLMLVTHNDYRWIELEGNTLRAKHAYTGRVVERTVEEIACLDTIVYQVQTLETDVAAKILGRIRGMEIRFRDGRTPLRVLRTDPAMTHAKELLEAVLYRMSEIQPLDVEFDDSRGQPLVRSIHWRGQPRPAAPRQTAKLCLACAVFLGLLFGSLFGFLGREEQQRHALAAVPPQEMELRTLIANGPGSNRHVTLTNLVPAGYAFESRFGSWTNVWIAVYPADLRRDESSDIPVVLMSKTIGSPEEVEELLHRGRVTGICSDTRRSRWGSPLGQQLAGAIPGSRLVSAWTIDDLTEPPSGVWITASFAAAASCFAIALTLATVVLRKMR